MNRSIVKRAMINALATAAYVTLVGVFMFNANHIFGEEDKFLSPVVALLLFVLSAGITASLTFGQPVMWYVDGKKKEALQLLGATLASLAALTVLAMVALAAL